MARFSASPPAKRVRSIPSGRALAIRTAKLALACLLILDGCGEVERPLTIATSWNPSERAGVEAVIRSTGAGPVRWLTLAAGDDLAAVARRRNPPDLILGGPVSAYEAMDRQGLLKAGNGEPTWRVARRSHPRFEGARLRPPGRPGRFLLDDPRRNPATLARMRSRLRRDDWPQGYAELVRLAGGLPGEPAVGPTEVIEGGAVVREARQQEAADALLRALADPEGRSPAIAPDADALLADLLGATLIDARDELESAFQAVRAAGRPARASGWMTQPPPWPPASVSKIVEREPNAMPLLETLAAEIAPEADVRAWLLRSWLTPARLVDDRLLDELAAAEHGRLVREPRFRAWLRAEWRAWARQRYRRVARLSASGQGGPPT